jgi:beta-lactamase regulating signal transducer with metallopeptidase domain
MTTHLVLSTVLLGMAMLAARVLPLRARTRYALLLLALLEFAIPAAAMTALLRLLGVDPVRAVAAMPFRILGATTLSTSAPAAPNWLLVIWATVAAVLFARWLIRRHRTIASALRTSHAPSLREHEALAAARDVLGIRTAIALTRSPLAEAPAVLRILRPVIVLPETGCDTLTDDELRSLFLHECAHVARRDNLLGILHALAGAALWFHPLVWLAVRQLAAAAEEACDQTVADTLPATEPYLTALAKLTRAALGPHPAGVSCMAAAHIKQRLEHLMAYDRLRHTALSHRAVLTLTLAAILATTFLTAACTTAPAPIRAVPKTTHTATSYHGDPISLNLKDAQLSDVLNSFAQLTGYSITLAPGITGTVTIDVADVPWDQALDVIARQNNLTVAIEGKTIRVYR